MAWSHFQIAIAFVMVVTGSINTLSTAWADKLTAADFNGTVRKFSHPFVQSCAMFLGELFCLLIFKLIYIYYRSKRDGSETESDIVRGNTNFNPFIFLPPAFCDMIATSLMYIALTLTYPSSFQMFRGAIIIFTALLSVAFLGKKISGHEWLGMLLVIVGLVTVGFSDYLLNKSSEDKNKPVKGIITGDVLIIIATVIQALQMVYEEKFVVTKDIPPLQAVGWEGMFGFTTLAILLYPFYLIPLSPPYSNNSRNVIEDLPEALFQMKNNPLIILSITGTIVSIAFFNYAGVTVTKELSATTRMILDSARTFFIWMISLYLEWSKFHPLQILGFSLLLLGMSTYNNIRPSSLLELCKKAENDENPILVTPPDDTP